MKPFLCSTTALSLLAALLVSCNVNEDENEEESFDISSSSFEADGPLPADYSCEGKVFGEGIAPELNWTSGPKATKSYAIVFKDLSLVNGPTPDYAYHWMIWNIPAGVRSLPKGLSGDEFPAAMSGAQQYSAGPDGGYAYFGPCPSWQTYCSAGEKPAVQDTYSFTIYAFDKILTLPAKDTTIATNYVRQIDAYFVEKAIAKAEIKTRSGAVPDNVPFCTPEISTPGMEDTEYPYLSIVGSDFLEDSAAALNAWYDDIHIPLLMEYPGLVKAARYQTVAGSTPGYLGLYYYPTLDDLNGMPTSTPFDTANKELAEHWPNGEYTLALAVSYEKIKSWVKEDYTGELAMATIVGSEFTEGKEEAVSNWYNNIHIPLMMKYPGIKKAARYKKLEGGVNTDSLPTYLAVFYYGTADDRTNLKSSPEWAAVVENQASETVDDDMIVKKSLTASLIKTHTK